MQKQVGVLNEISSSRTEDFYNLPKAKLVAELRLESRSLSCQGLCSSSPHHLFCALPNIASRGTKSSAANQVDLGR